MRNTNNGSNRTLKIHPSYLSLQNVDPVIPVNNSDVNNYINIQLNYVRLKHHIMLCCLEIKKKRTRFRKPPGNVKKMIISEPFLHQGNLPLTKPQPPAGGTGTWEGVSSNRGLRRKDVFLPGRRVMRLLCTTVR